MRCSRRSRSRRARRGRTSPGSCSAATTCSRRSGRCRAASGRASSSRCSGSCPSNLLLLDEPTNHLDIPAREAIETFLVESPATLLVVSHDRRLLETVCSTLWVVDDGLAVPFDGGWKAWRTAVADGWTVHERPSANGGGSRVPVAAAPAATAAVAPVDEVARPVASRVRHEPVAAEGPPRTGADPSRPARSCRRTPTGARTGAVDAELTRLGLRKSQLELSMGSPAISANFVEMRRVTSELADVEQALATAEDAWLELEERAP